MDNRHFYFPLELCIQFRMFVLFRKPFVYGLTIKGYFNAIVKQHHQSNVVTCNDSIFIQFHLNEKTKLLTAHLIFKMKDAEGCP